MRHLYLKQSCLHYFLSIAAHPLFLPNTCPCWVPFPFSLLPFFFLLSLNLPFSDMTGCHGNCLLMEGAAAAAISQLDSVARQQVTWRSLATTLLQEPANPLNLSLSPSPHTSLFILHPPVCLLRSSSPKLLLMLQDLSFFHGTLPLLIIASLPLWR